MDEKVLELAKQMNEFYEKSGIKLATDILALEVVAANLRLLKKSLSSSQEAA